MQAEASSPIITDTIDRPQAQERAHVGFNFTVNVLDGSFFGLALGIASFVTVIPLFVNQMTDSTTLIGLVSALHHIGWQLPQLLTANYVARLRRFKRMVLFMTIHERWPFFALALLALMMPTLGTQVSLILTIILVTWQALGGGLTATAWQSMIAKLLPNHVRGLFYGTQSGMANLLSSGGAVLAGAILSGLDSPEDFALCFFLAGIAMVISGGFLASTKEWTSPPRHDAPAEGTRALMGNLRDILRVDANFRWFVLARALMQVAGLGMGFYTIYATRRFDMDVAVAGVLTGILMLGQTVASPVLGRLGDARGHRIVFIIGVLILFVGSVLAWIAPDISWFYLIFALAGIGNASLWGPTNAIIADFGDDRRRPFYIGLTNTLIAPFTIVAPIIGGALADSFGFEATFAASSLGGALALFVLLIAFKEPRTHHAR